MAKSNRERYEKYRDRIQSLEQDGVMSSEDCEAILEFLDSADPESALINGDSMSDGTLARYAYTLKRIPELSDFNLSDASEYKINKIMDDIRRGNVDGVKEGGLTSGSVRNHQSTIRKFYKYHDDFNVDPEEIMLFEPNDSSVDERDILTRDEFNAIRKAAQHPRDKALVELLGYTGQRIAAILNLRLKDMKPEDGVFYLNTSDGDMKGAEGARSLLLAEHSVRKWKNNHPCTDDPEAHFICKKNVDQNNGQDLGDKMDHSSIYRLLQNIGERAGVDKPTNPHNFRHTFVTWAKRDKGMDNDTIKHIIGHDPDSTVMETTYAHLTDEDMMKNAEQAVGLIEEEDDSPFVPDNCPACQKPLEGSEQFCPDCGSKVDIDADKDDIEEKLDQFSEDELMEFIQERMMGN
ncbi:tyrosine-type recombinase/integrase [Natrinema sp. DC36]|uniref:tyrosine-type recombinase/integrase n=1 Tax=Natrinema sp. DC36 TaxID=2878680 RepID=UPI001CEFFA0F|nr:tyrosine-type recombinase/integrase [Natrinema sp. DC36]